MNVKVVDYKKIDEVDADGIRLFKIMMRLEFALKDTGYAKAGADQPAEVNWDKYAKDMLGNDFYCLVKENPQVSILWDNPPKKQFVNSQGILEWRDADQPQNVQDLLVVVRRIRNNLFHGGKSGEPDQPRNKALYTAALSILDAILLFDDHVLTVFSGNY